MTDGAPLFLWSWIELVRSIATIADFLAAIGPLQVRLLRHRTCMCNFRSFAMVFPSDFSIYRTAHTKQPIINTGAPY